MFVGGMSWRESELISTVKPSHEQRLHPPKKESQSFSGSDLWSQRGNSWKLDLFATVEKSFDVPILVDAPIWFGLSLQ